MNNLIITNFINKIKNYEALLDINNSQKIDRILLAEAIKCIQHFGERLPLDDIRDNQADLDRILMIIKEQREMKKSHLTMRAQWAGKSSDVRKLVETLIEQGKVTERKHLNGIIYTALI